MLADVSTFNFHPHLPHYELTAPESDALRVLGRQLVDPTRPHPFTEAGNAEFNALIWMPPASGRAGDIVLVDSTNFTTLFGGTDSLEAFLEQPGDDGLTPRYGIAASSHPLMGSGGGTGAGAGAVRGAGASAGAGTDKAVGADAGPGDGSAAMWASAAGSCGWTAGRCAAGTLGRLLRRHVRRDRRLRRDSPSEPLEPFGAQRFAPRIPARASCRSNRARRASTCAPRPVPPCCSTGARSARSATCTWIGRLGGRHRHRTFLTVGVRRTVTGASGAGRRGDVLLVAGRTGAGARGEL